MSTRYFGTVTSASVYDAQLKAELKLTNTALSIDDLQASGSNWGCRQLLACQVIVSSTAHNVLPAYIKHTERVEKTQEIKDFLDGPDPSLMHHSTHFLITEYGFSLGEMWAALAALKHYPRPRVVSSNEFDEIRSAMNMSTQPASKFHRAIPRTRLPRLAATDLAVLVTPNDNRLKSFRWRTAPRPRHKEGQVDAPSDASTAVERNGLFSLPEAASAGDAGTVWFILAQASSGTMHDQARSAICLAARAGHEPLVSQLLARRDTSTLITDSGGRTALSHAAECGQEAIVRFLLSSARIHPDTGDIHGITALWYAVYHRHTTCAKLLLQKGLVSGNVGGSGNTQTALWHAVSSGDLDLVKLLLQNKALHPAGGEPILCAAASHEYPAIAELLLQQGVDPEERDTKRRSPLHIACRQDNHEIVALLMRQGVNADRLDPTGKTELAFATLRGNVALVKALLENGANPRAKCANGKTAAYAKGQEMKSLIGNQRWYKTLLDRTNTNRSALS
ncbi:Ankyrin repeat [Fusarium oxysporum f. sp. vasinfectum]|nr:Ankyrin repeat [Fusarium oxysporum f. sp. vasinfectum]